MTTSDRIVRRFLASQPLDEKMKVLLLKLRKGADASLTMGGLMKLLTLLGGWKVEKGFGLIAEHHNPMKKGDEYELLAEESEQSATFYYEKLKQDEVSSLPTRPTKGKRYVMDLEPLHTWESFNRQVWGAKYKLWTTAPSLTFTDPKGKTFEALPPKWSSKTEKDIKVYDILKWMKAESTYMAQINELLGMEAHEPAAPRTRDGTGTCGACFRNIKLVQKGTQPPVMALHGYNRPGNGFTVGRCWGGDHSPYELSKEATQIIVDLATKNANRLRKRLGELNSGHVEEFNTAEFDRGKGRVIRKSDPNPRPDIDMWAYDLKDHVRRCEDSLRRAEWEEKLYGWLVNNWKLRELPVEGAKHIDWYAEATKHIRKAT